MEQILTAKEKRNERQRRYRKYGNGTIIASRYSNSEKGKETRSRYKKSEQGLQSIARGMDHKRRHQQAYAKSPAGKDVQRKADLRHREHYPERVNARQVLNRAIRCGQVVRENCEICGEIAEAHHADYAKPLEVRWLCKVHHEEIH